jgi:hypothetical protein
VGGPRRGRRDNGIDAADFAVAGDVDPRVGEHLLDVLGASGIAAYLQPTADLNPILRATTLPARPTDRLYVDRTQLEIARDYLVKATGGEPVTQLAPPAPDPTSQPEIDAEWAKIIAGFDTAPDPTADPPWPEAEGIAPGGDGTAPDSTRPDGTGPEPPKSPGLESAIDFSGIQLNRRRTDPMPLEGFDDLAADFDEDDERYVPPPPPPLPHFSKYAVFGVLGVVVGFILILHPALLPVDGDYVTLLGFAAIVSGAVMLVWRLRSGDPDDDDDFDDGAVV